MLEIHLPILTITWKGGDEINLRNVWFWRRTFESSLQSKSQTSGDYYSTRIWKHPEYFLLLPPLSALSRVISVSLLTVASFCSQNYPILEENYKVILSCIHPALLPLSNKTPAELIWKETWLSSSKVHFLIFLAACVASYLYKKQAHSACCLLGTLF